jgi:hypothetical protein
VGRTTPATAAYDVGATASRCKWCVSSLNARLFPAPTCCRENQYCLVRTQVSGKGSCQANRRRRVQARACNGNRAAAAVHDCKPQAGSCRAVAATSQPSILWHCQPHVWRPASLLSVHKSVVLGMPPQYTLLPNPRALTLTQRRTDSPTITPQCLYPTPNHAHTRAHAHKYINLCTFPQIHTQHIRMHAHTHAHIHAPTCTHTHAYAHPQAAAYFPKALYKRLESDLLAYGERVLGCRSISPIWMSYYVDGCAQELHCGGRRHALVCAHVCVCVCVCACVHVHGCVCVLGFADVDVCGCMGCVDKN